MAAGDGLISMTPSSIAHSGTSASINADGGVDFSGVTSLSLNGVFTSDYDNYLIVLAGRPDTTAGNVRMRMRASGSSDSGTNYTRQYLQAVTTAVNAARTTSTTEATIGSFGTTTADSSYMIHVYGPYLAQPTNIRNVGAQVSAGDPAITDNANTHSLSTSYDGFEMLPLNAASGTIHVFGYEE